MASKKKRLRKIHDKKDPDMITNSFFAHITEEIGIKAKKIGLSGHNATIGARREILLSDYFKKLMPSFFNYGNGVVIDSKGKKSKQEDLVVYSPFIGGFDEESSLFPVESICATIEIKSYLDKQRLKEAFENIKSIKDLSYDKNFIPEKYVGEWKDKILCNIFAYDSIDPKLLKKYIFEIKKELKLRDEQMFDNLCVNGICVFTKNPNALERFNGKEYVCLLLKENSIPYFIDLIINGMNIPLSPVPLFIKYLGTFDVEHF